jgi:hypothetical protein
MVPSLHDDIAHLSFLLGEWHGSGEGRYPTIESFGYNEQVEFRHVGKPFVSYVQRTKHAETGLPLHAESGYLRPVGVDAVEFVVVQPSGIVEVHAGSVDAAAGSIVLEATEVLTTPTAKEVSAVRRSLSVDGDALSYTVDMGAVGQPLQHHLSATLHRQ